MMGVTFPRDTVDVLLDAFNSIARDDGLDCCPPTPSGSKGQAWPRHATRLIVGISGASGTVYGVRLLEMLRDADIETHLVMSKSAEMTMAYETDLKPKDVRALAAVHYPVADIGAAISSGSFPTMGMVIAPCSIRTMSEIASGVTASLLSRAADVVLKERRRLVLAVRETPLHVGHLRSMTTLAEIGAVVAPDRAGVLQSAQDRRRHHQSHVRPAARPVRHRHRHRQTLEGRPGGRLTSSRGSLAREPASRLSE